MVRGSGVFPLATTGREMNVARRKLVVNPRVRKIGDVIRGIVEIKIVVVHAVHEIAQVVDTGHRETTLDDIGMFEERVCSVIGAEGSAHGGDGNLRLAVVPDKGNDFFAQVRIELRLNVAAMERMSGLVVEALAVDGIDAVEFDAPCID